MRNTFVRWRVAVQTTLVVLGIIAAKLVIAAFSWEFIELSPLFTSVVAGGVFVLGVGSVALGVIFMIIWRFVAPAYFKRKTMNESISISETGEVIRTD